MTSNTDLRTGAMRHRALSVVVQLFGDVPEESSTAYGGLPSRLVDGELLEVLQVDDNSVVLSTDACKVQLETYSSWATRTVVCIRVPPATGLHLQIVVDSTFDDR